MISYDEMPDDNSELAKIDIDFPYLKDNSPNSCPSSLDDIIEYLSVECPKERGSSLLLTHYEKIY